VRPLKVVAYLRVSTEVQAEKGLGLEVQEGSVRAWARAHGHKLAGVERDEGISGSFEPAQRPGLAKALGAADHDQLHADWPAEGGPWRLTFHWQDLGGYPEIVELTIKQTDRGAPVPITGRSLRAVPIKRVFNQLIAYSETLRTDFPDQAYDGDWTPTVVLDPPRVGSHAEQSAGGRDEKLTTVARVYMAAHRDGRPPTKAVAEHFGARRSTAANWVQACRKTGLLKPANGPSAAP